MLKEAGSSIADASANRRSQLESAGVDYGSREAPSVHGMVVIYPGISAPQLYKSREDRDRDLADWRRSRK
jgi:hypothetical protein